MDQYGKPADVPILPRYILSFSGSPKPRLRITKFHPPAEPNRKPEVKTCVEGKVGAGQFEWREGVQALCICLIQYRCYPSGKLEQKLKFEFEGDENHPAKSLDNLLHKVDGSKWLKGMFTTTADSGDLWIKKYFKRRNPNRKDKNENYILQIQDGELPQASIIIELDGKEIGEEERLMELAWNIEDQWLKADGAEKSILAKFKTARKKWKTAYRLRSKQPVGVKAEPKSKMFCRKAFSRQLKQEIDEWFLKATQNPEKSVSYAKLCRQTNKIQAQFVKQTGHWPDVVRGACDLARGYLNPDTVERWKQVYRGIGLLVTTAGGVAIVFGIITAFGIGLGLWASLWAAIAGSTGPLTGGLTLVVGIAAVGGGIFAAIGLDTPQSLSAKAHDVIIKAIDFWADTEEATKQDREAKEKIDAERKKLKSASKNQIPPGKNEPDLMKDMMAYMDDVGKKITDFKWPWT